MALSTRCIRCLTLAADILFMVWGVAAAVLLLVFLLPLVSLLTLPRWLLPPLLLPLLPALLAVLLGSLAFSVTRSARAEQRWKLIGVALLQVLLALAMAVLAGWQVFLWFSPRIESDMASLMNGSLLDATWHTVYHELRCCGPAGPASFEGTTGIPTACCSREGPGPCSQIYSQGCVGPAAARIRGVFRDGAAVHGGVALLMFMCAVASAFYADALQRAHRKRRVQQRAQEDKPLTSPMINQRY